MPKILSFRPNKRKEQDSLLSTVWYAVSGLNRATRFALLSLLLLALALPVANRIQLEIRQQAAGTASPTDWPQLQHDAQRSGYTDQTIRYPGPYTIGWVWHPQNGMTRIAEEAQPVVAGGILAIGDLDGKMYGIDATSGNVNWTYLTNSAIYATAAIANNKVFFGAQNGVFYAVDAGTGQLVWSYQTGEGIVTAPLLVNNHVIIGSKDGKLYSFDSTTSTATLQWSFDAGSPIMMSPAASANNNVYFGAENLKAYAVNMATGTKVWEKQLNGQSFVHLWPVISDRNSVVIFRTQPIWDHGNMLNDPNTTLENGHCQNFTFGECHVAALAGSAECSQTCAGGSIQATASDYDAEQTRIKNYLQANPSRKTFYALNLSDGNEKYIAPILHTAGGGETPAPPVVDEINNRAWVIYRSYYSMFDSGSTVRPYVDVAKMDLSTGVIRPFKCANLSGESCKMGYEDFHLVGDEMSFLSANQTGVMVGNENSLGGINLSLEQSFFVVSAATWLNRTPTLMNATWPSGSYAGSGGNPIGVFANGKIYFKAGLLGMLQ